MAGLLDELVSGVSISLPRAVACPIAPALVPGAPGPCPVRVASVSRGLCPGLLVAVPLVLRAIVLLAVVPGARPMFVAWRTPVPAPCWRW